jgi:carbonic anhydrase
VVLGHEKCGAVIAACSGDKVPSPNLQSILDQISPAVTRAKSCAQSDALVDSAIRENVHQSAADILEHSEELQHAAKDGKLTIVEAVYKLDSGEVVRLSKPAVQEKARSWTISDVFRFGSFLGRLDFDGTVILASS